MPSIRQSIRSSTSSKRPTSAIADGQIALNTASGTPGIFFKDNANNIIKAGPAHYGASAPNSSPAVGGSTGNSIGEAWLDSSLTPAGWKIWNGSAWVNATPLSSDTVQGLVELATDAEVQAGVDTARAVTAAGLQSKVSDSISTTSSSGIASSSAVKTAYDLANAALPKSGGIITGNLEIGSTGSFTFEGATADGFETTLAVVDPTADRTITFPDITGTVITTADTGTVTSTMIANGTIVDADINSSAAIAFSKLASLASANILIGNASGVPTSTTVSGDVTITNAGVTAITSNVIVNADINSAAAIAYSKLALASGIVNTDISASAAVAYSKLALSNSIVNADINSAAAIAGTKISPDFGSQNLTTTGNITATNHIAASGTATIPSIQVGNGTTYKPGIYSPGTDQVAISTNGTGRLFVNASGLTGLGVSSITAGLTVATYGSQPETNANTYAYPVGRHHVNLGTVPNATNLWAGFVGTYGNSSGSCNLLLQPGYNDLSQQAGAYIGGELTGVASTAITFGHLTGGATLAGNSTKLERLRITPAGSLNFKGAGTAGVTQAVSFNGSAPVDSLVITSGGLVGLGTSSPDGPLHVFRASAGTVTANGNADELVVENSSAGGISILTPDANHGYLIFGSPSDNEGAVIRYRHDDKIYTIGTEVTGGSILLRTGAGTSAVTIDSSQRVGIGTTSPSNQLHVSSTSNTPAQIQTTGGTACYLYLSNTGGGGYLSTQSDNLVFHTSGAATERARIDSSGRLLVGTSSARSNYFNSINTALLQIEGTAGGSTRGMSSIVNNSTSDDPPWLLIGKSNGSSVGSNSIVGNGTILGVLGFAGNDGSEFVNAAFISAAVDGTPGANDMPGRLVFSVTADGSASPTEAMRINNAGELLVGYTTDNGAYKLQVNSQIFATSATIATSDGRYKENVASLGGCLDLVKALRPVSFTWKPQEDITRIDDEGNEVLVREGHNFPEGTQVGFIAQEVQEVLDGKPWLSSVIKENVRPAVKDNEGNELAPEEQFYGIAEGNLIAVLTNALQEAVGRIEALEAEVAALKS
jgi:hypothetical protein